MQGNVYAYIRVSSKEQNEARQLNDILKIGIDEKNIIVEKASGKTFNRASYNKLLKKLKSGDVLYIQSIDRLGRDYNGIIEQWHKLTNKMNVFIKVLDMPTLDTDKKAVTLIEKYINDITLLTLAFQAEQEWQNIKSRQANGIATAKEKGKHLGRPKKECTQKEVQIVNLWKKNIISLDKAMELLGKKKSAFYKLVKNIES